MQRQIALDLLAVCIDQRAESKKSYQDVPNRTENKIYISLYGED